MAYNDVSRNGPWGGPLVGRDPETVRRWIRSGRLRSEKVGTQHLVREEDLSAMVTEGELPLPDAWKIADNGSMPPWGQLVRDGRRSH